MFTRPSSEISILVQVYSMHENTPYTVILPQFSQEMKTIYSLPFFDIEYWKSYRPFLSKNAVDKKKIYISLLLIDKMQTPSRC